MIVMRSVLIVFGGVCLCVLAEVTEDDVSFFLYNQSENGTTIKSPGEIQPSSNNIVFITHGWVATGNESTMVDLAQAFVNKGNYTAVTVDWSLLAYELYTVSAGSVPGVAQILGELIVKLVSDYNISLSSIHLVGHSLGAHISGFAGKYLQNTLNESIPRITALDAAGPLFEEVWVTEDERLNPNDADLVVAIHTDGGQAGYSSDIGDIDFYPNGGTALQPGCLEEILEDFEVSCSHTRSVYIYTEAVQNPDGFVSQLCDTYLFYQLGLCDDNESVTIGGSLTIDNAGSYYLYTNSESPYSQE